MQSSHLSFRLLVRDRTEQDMQQKNEKENGTYFNCFMHYSTSRIIKKKNTHDAMLIPQV